MWIVIKKEIVYPDKIVFGYEDMSREEIIMDRIVDSLDEVEKGELFFMCNIKK